MESWECSGRGISLRRKSPISTGASASSLFPMGLAQKAEEFDGFATRKLDETAADLTQNRTSMQ